MTLSHTGTVRTFELIQYVTAPLEGGIKDWPSHIQDAIYEALEKKAQQVELPLTIVDAGCLIDYADEEGQADRFYVLVMASEIVVRDERFTSEAAMKAAFDELIAKETKH